MNEKLSDKRREVGALKFIIQSRDQSQILAGELRPDRTGGERRDSAETGVKTFFSMILLSAVE